MSTALTILFAVLVATAIIIAGREDHTGCHGRAMCRKCVTRIPPLGCAHCLQRIDDEAGAHDVDGFYYHPWHCPEPSCVEEDEAASW